jgi:hypothetical protein
MAIIDAQHCRRRFEFDGLPGTIIVHTTEISAASSALRWVLILRFNAVR